MHFYSQYSLFDLDKLLKLWKKEDIIWTNDVEASLIVHEPKMKVPTMSFWIQGFISYLFC